MHTRYVANRARGRAPEGRPADRNLRAVFDGSRIKGIIGPRRDVRGFAVKAYTEEGNWDLRDALVFELGKCKLARIRRPIVGHLRNIDDGCVDLGIVEDGDRTADFVASCAKLRHWTRGGMA